MGASRITGARGTGFEVGGELIQEGVGAGSAASESGRIAGVCRGVDRRLKAIQASMEAVEGVAVDADGELGEASAAGALSLGVGGILAGTGHVRALLSSSVTSRYRERGSAPPGGGDRGSERSGVSHRDRATERGAAGDRREQEKRSRSKERERSLGSHRGGERSRPVTDQCGVGAVADAGHGEDGRDE
jgi:hypothetical protein